MGFSCMFLLSETLREKLNFKTFREESSFQQGVPNTLTHLSESVGSTLSWMWGCG